MLRIPVSELDTRVPRWEQQAWEEVFDLVGPLDWRRADLLDARDALSRCGERGDKIDDFVLFPEPRKEKTVEELEELLFKEF